MSVQGHVTKNTPRDRQDGYNWNRLPKHLSHIGSILGQPCVLDGTVPIMLFAGCGKKQRRSVNKAITKLGVMMSPLKPWLLAKCSLILHLFQVLSWKRLIHDPAEEIKSGCLNYHIFSNKKTFWAHYCSCGILAVQKTGVAVIFSLFVCLFNVSEEKIALFLRHILMAREGLGDPEKNKLILSSCVIS